MLVINLRIGAAADCCCGNSSSLLLPDSVKPAVQRGVQNSRGFVPPEAERIRARRPELDGTTRLTETRGTGHGRTAEREVASGASDKTTRKTRDRRRRPLRKSMRDAASLHRSLAAAGDMAADAARTRSAGLRPTAARACHGSAWRCAARTLHCTKLRQQGEAPELER